MNYIDVGFKNYVEASRILTISKPSSAPIKRLVKEAKSQNMHVDLTEGKKTRSIITQTSTNGLVVISSYRLPHTLVERMKKGDSMIIDEEIIEGITTTLVQ